MTDHDHAGQVASYGECLTCAHTPRVDPRPAVTQNTTTVPATAPQTSQDAAERVYPRTGTLRRRIVDLIASDGPLADDELEDRLNGSHQSVSASRRSLVLDGWLVDSGQRAIVRRSGNEAIRWTLADLDTPTNNG